jgi:hypothetical protein
MLTTPYVGKSLFICFFFESWWRKSCPSGLRF